MNDRTVDATWKTAMLNYGYNVYNTTNEAGDVPPTVQMTKLATGFKRDGILQSSKSSVSTCTLLKVVLTNIY